MCDLVKMFNNAQDSLYNVDGFGNVSFRTVLKVRSQEQSIIGSYFKCKIVRKMSLVQLKCVNKLSVLNACILHTVYKM